MKIVPITLAQAKQFVEENHRHNKPPVGHKFSVGLLHYNDLFDVEEVIGVGIAGRPVARMMDDGYTLEVIRLCVLNYAPRGACSMIYRALWRAWKELGGRRMITYTLQSESGASLRGAGWIRAAELAPRTGEAWTNRAGRDDQSVVREAKVRWEISATGAK